MVYNIHRSSGIKVFIFLFLLFSSVNSVFSTEYSQTTIRIGIDIISVSEAPSGGGAGDGNLMYCDDGSPVINGFCPCPNGEYPNEDGICLSCEIGEVIKDGKCVKPGFITLPKISQLLNGFFYNIGVMFMPSNPMVGFYIISSISISVLVFFIKRNKEEKKKSQKRKKKRRKKKKKKR